MIVLESKDFPESKINKVANYTALNVPVVNYSNGILSWLPVEGAKTYQVMRNGKLLQNTAETMVKVTEPNYSEYQVMAADENQVSSFASEPIVVAWKQFLNVYQLEKFAPKSGKNYKDFEGEGFVEISKTVNRSINMPMEINSRGTYAISFRYANGNGPINTENKCAIRTLKADGRFMGTIVLPQRGTNEWSNWGFTNSMQMKLTEGKHQLSISFEPANENMNGEINQAMPDALYIYQIK